MNPITTDHFTDADGTHFVDGHPAPCCGGYDERPGARGKWVPLDALVIERDEYGKVPTRLALDALSRLSPAWLRDAFNEGATDPWVVDDRVALIRAIVDALEAAGGETPE